MWLKNTWYVAAFARDVRDKLIARRYLDVPVVLYRRLDGQVVALEDRCPHRSLPLSLGILRDDHLTCGYHGMQFDSNGSCVRIPGQDTIPARANVRSFPVIERHGLVWIWLGERSRAESTPVPELSVLDDDNWVASDGYHWLGADYRLLVDNLLDLSHLTFVHGRTIGNTAVAEAPIHVTQDGEVVKVRRDIVGAMAPAFYAYLGQYRKPIHRWQVVNYHLPSTCVIDIGCKALEPGDGIGDLVGQVIHLATPESAKSTHYFWAFVRRFRQRDDALTEYIRQAIADTLDEDKATIEAQFAALDPAILDQPVSLALQVDQGPIRGRRLLARRLDAERAGTAPPPETADTGA